MNIRTATDNDVPQLKRLFEICFGDTDEFLNLFFTGYFPAIEGLVATCDGQVAAMLFICPASFLAGGVRESLYYIYACATDPAFRRQGLMKALLDEAAERTKQRKVRGLLLVPADEHLRSYYAACGFVPFSSLGETVLPSPRNDSFQFARCKLTPDRIATLRQRLLQGNYCVEWGVKHIEMSIRMLELSGGGVVGLVLPDGTAEYAICRRDECLTVLETTVDKTLWTALSQFLKQHFGVETVRFCFPDNDGTPYAMIRTVDSFLPSADDVPYFCMDMG
jgi:GNAT superfamily N-acetyltransferase